MSGSYLGVRSIVSCTRQPAKRSLSGTGGKAARTASGWRGAGVCRQWTQAVGAHALLPSESERARISVQVLGSRCTCAFFQPGLGPGLPFGLPLATASPAISAGGGGPLTLQCNRHYWYVPPRPHVGHEVARPGTREGGHGARRVIRLALICWRPRWCADEDRDGAPADSWSVLK